jgi:hypothetical protein
MRCDGLSAIVHVCSQFFLASNWNGARPVFFNILNDLLQLGGMCTWVPNRLNSSWQIRLERDSGRVTGAYYRMTKEAECLIAATQQGAQGPERGVLHIPRLVLAEAQIAP